MDTRMKKYRQLSPDRAKVWTERSPKYQQKIKKVAVVYYLCRNSQLEHPHFMEVPLSSSDGLHLRDVIERLNVLRGRGMASMYSWSSKRSYRNGFVWHDLSEDDLIIPAHGNEYVLKGSEIFSNSNSDHFNPVASTSQNLKQLPEPASSRTSRSQDDSSSSSSMTGKGTKNSQEDEVSPPAPRSGSSGVSPESGNEKNSSWGGSLSLIEYKVYNSQGSSDASTQTEEIVPEPKTQEICIRGVSTDDGSLEGSACIENHQILAQCVKESPDICRDSVSPSPSNVPSLSGKIETLESLIRADASKMNSFRIVEDEDIRIPTNTRLKATDILMQLISCGSIAVKDNSYGLVRTYRPNFSHSPFFSLGELDGLAEDRRRMGLRLEDKEYYSGSLVETRLGKAVGDSNNTSLKRSSSYNADRTCKQSDSAEKGGDSEPSGLKCIPTATKASVGKQPLYESTKSPGKPRSSSELAKISHYKNHNITSNGCSSKMVTESSKRSESFREEQDKVIKIEERLASGARVIIQYNAGLPLDAIPSWT